jgi:hypothetical protein
MTIQSDSDNRAMAGLFTFDLDGQKVDGRTQAARFFKTEVTALIDQLGRTPKPSDTYLLRNAATLAYLCDRDTARLMAGQTVDEENLRRNVQALGGVLIKLGMASKSRDVTKGSSQGNDPFADAINATYSVSS